MGGSNAVVSKFEIHEMSVDNGVMKMRMLANGIEIKPGQTIEFKPGSYHLMFVGISQPLEQGKRVKGTLEFEKAGKVDVEYAVEAIGGAPKGEAGGEHNGHPGHRSLRREPRAPRFRPGSWPCASHQCPSW